MKVEVRPFRVKGRLVPYKQRIAMPSAVGWLEVKEARMPRLGRSSVVARVVSPLDPLRPDALPALTDVQLLWAAEGQMHLTGSEQVEDAAYVQTWDVKVVAC